jgi:hypothetical protein
LILCDERQNASDQAQDHEWQQPDELPRNALARIGRFDSRQQAGFSVPAQWHCLKEKQDDGQSYGRGLGQECQDKASQGSAVPTTARPPNAESEVSIQPGQPEERVEDILALGDPGDRFHMQRMHREEAGDEEGRPLAQAQFARDGEQDERAANMEPQTGQVMRSGTEAEQFAVKLMG